MFKKFPQKLMDLEAKVAQLQLVVSGDVKKFSSKKIRLNFANIFHL